MQKYAFLVTAHTDIEQLKRLSKRLMSLGDIYLLIDKKQKDENYLTEVQTLVSNSGGAICLAQPRISIAWAGFSVCVGQRILLDACVKSGKEYDRVFFLSGLDYVLVSDEEFRAFFEANKEKEFVCGFNISRCHEERQLRRIKYYHLFRDIPLKHTSFLRRAIIVGTRLALRTLGFRKPLSIPVGGTSWDVYYGSEWTSMTFACAKYVLKQMHENDVVRKYFATSYAPDELYIPTIVMNSEYGKHAIPCDSLDFKILTPLHYLNYIGFIFTYDENDYGKLMSSGKIFVRKLVSGKSEKLIEMIDRNHRKNNKDC